MELLVIVIGMSLVTYLPRLLPLVGLKNMQLPPRMAIFLRYVPIAALGSLIFPSIIYSTGSIYSALVGSAAAVLLALLRMNIMLVVIGAIIVVMLWELLTASSLPGAYSGGCFILFEFYDC